MFFLEKKEDTLIRKLKCGMGKVIKTIFFIKVTPNLTNYWRCLGERRVKTKFKGIHCSLSRDSAGCHESVKVL